MGDGTQAARGEAGPTSVPRGEAYEVLANPRRRAAVRHLLSRDGAARLGDMAREIAAWENGTDPRDVSSAERERVYISLLQLHMPRLDDAGVVAYDDRGKTARATPAGEALAPLVGPSTTEEAPDLTS